MPPGWVAGQTLTLSTGKLDGVRTFTPAWRYTDTDDAAFAGTGFSDGDWRLVAPGSSLSGAHHLREPGSTHVWARLHLVLRGPTRPLALALRAVSITSYEVYVNGELTAQSPGFARSRLQHAEPFPIPLPSTSEVTIAVRFLTPRFAVLRSFPISEVQLGNPAAVRTETQFERLRDFDDTQLAELISIALSTAVAIFAATLFLAQRSRREYLWLAFLSLTYVVLTGFGVLIHFGSIEASLLNLFLYRVAGCITNVLLMEFTPLLIRVRPYRVARVLQLAFLVLPVFSLLSDMLFSDALLLAMAALTILLGAYLIQALRQRNTEALLLCCPLSLLLLGTLLLFGNTLFPTGVPFPQRMHLGSVGVNAAQLPLWLIFVTVFGIMLFRYLRVSRTEQQAAAQLDAARSIQNLLIPNQLPKLQDLSIASVYQPALQVGGDFFQVLPLTSGTLIALGDVSGKGVPAALTVALLLGMLRAVATETQSPAAILAALNRHLHGYGAGFTTCVLVRLDCVSKRMLISSAGHLDPYVDGKPIALEPNLPLGVVPEAQFAEQEFAFHRGQTLTLLTDGVVEAFHPQTRELFGFDRTLAISHLPASQIAAAVAAFTSTALPTDDITILTVTHA